MDTETWVILFVIFALIAIAGIIVMMDKKRNGDDPKQ